MKMTEYNKSIKSSRVVSTMVRSNEVLDALNTLHFKIDDRTEEDFLLYIEKLSHFVDYYDISNTKSGDWSQFFSSDKTFILLLISSWNISQLRLEWIYLVNHIDEIYSESEKRERLNDFFNGIQEQLKSNELQLINIQESVLSIRETLNQRLPELHKSINEIIETIKESTELNQLMSNPYFNKQVNQLFDLIDSWKAQTRYVIDYLLSDYNGHHPHIALMLTFLKLLGYVQSQLNNYTQKHLRFYYNDVLRLKPKSSQPDFVYLIVNHRQELPFLLSCGTVFTAGKSTLGALRLYETIDDTFIDKVKLSELYTKHFNGTQFVYRNITQEINNDIQIPLFNEDGELYNLTLMITSPLFFLNSGKRVIKIKIQHNFSQYIKSGLSFRVSLDDKWLEFKDVLPDNSSVYSLIIDADEKPITTLNNEIHDTKIVSEFPAVEIKFMDSKLYGSITDIEVGVDVVGFKSYEINTEYGLSPNDKPFLPFGTLPSKGNFFIIKSNEFLQKKNAVATIQFDFTESKVESINKKSLDNNKFTINLPNTHIDKTFGDNEFTSFRFELTDPKYRGNTYMNSYIKQSQKETPQLPYLPKINSIIFDYRTNLTSQLKDLYSRIYKVTPLGYELFSTPIQLEQNNEAKSEILLGFDNVSSSTTFQVLFQIKEGAMNPLLKPADVKWEFLNDDKWIELKRDSVIDNTNKLLYSGLVTFVIPIFEQLKSSLFTDNLFWIRATISDKRCINDIIGIHTQVVTAIRRLTDEYDFEEHLAAGTIKKIQGRNNINFKISQPYASFGGRIKEDEALFETRVSQRMKHKGRAITARDYAQLLLERFSEIDSVKVINHYCNNNGITCSSSAGYIGIVPVAKSYQIENSLWRPFVPQNRIVVYQKFLDSISSPHARVQIMQPQLERISIECKVKFKDTFELDRSLMLKSLIMHINQFLSPWAYNNNRVEFTDQIVFSKIIQLIDNFSYVDYIADFKIHQYMLNDEDGEEMVIVNKEVIIPQTAYTLFVPHEQHNITFI